MGRVVGKDSRADDLPMRRAVASSLGWTRPGTIRLAPPPFARYPAPMISLCEWKTRLGRASTRCCPAYESGGSRLAAVPARASCFFELVLRLPALTGSQMTDMPTFAG